MTVEHLGIVELGDVCAQMNAENMALFHELGAWATSDGDAAQRRWFATACHRHAWHAELWGQRAPAIPGAPPIPSAELDESTRVLGESPDANAYRRELESMSERLEVLDSRIVDDLDPSTRRVVSLVGRDIDELLDR